MKIKINFFKILISLINNGGESEIRTHERVAPLPVFKTGAFNRNFVKNSGKNKLVECLLSVFEIFLAKSERYELSIDLHL